MRRRSPSEKAELYRVKFQAELWPAVAQAEGCDIRDSARRREIRARCWEEIGLLERGDAMPQTDAEFTALKTLCLHLADPDNITRQIAWQNCCANFRAFNDARISDHHQRKAGVADYRGRDTAAGQPLDDPLTRKQTTHRLIRMRSAARKVTLDHDKKFTDSVPAENCPF